MSLKIKSFAAGSGERFSLLFSSHDPWPLFYPAAFICRSIRMSTTPGTQLVYLEAIKRLLEWLDSNNIDLETRFRRQEFLRIFEIDGLTRHLNAARRANPGQTISPAKGNTYVSYVAQYIKWLADEIVVDAYCPDVTNMINRQHRWILDKQISKSGSNSAKKQKMLNKHLTEEAHVQLEALWNDPFVKLFRSADRGSRLRTVVILRILYETGMRRGEMLALKLKSFSESVGGMNASLTIERNHHDDFDSRIAQPVAKTAGRIVPITPELEIQLTSYITEYRADVPGAGFADEEFIFLTHRTGRGQGQPLSISNCDQALASLKKAFPILCELHAHLLRHDWNFRFSKAADAAKISPHKEAELRRILMGWSADSDMANIYNARQLHDQAMNIGLQVAIATERPSSTATKLSTQNQSIAVVVAKLKK